jgi:hypothetical protein
MSLPYRHNNKWNVNELLTLQRDYELLEMTITEIAEKHERTIPAILYRLQSEDFIESWYDARGYQEYINTLTPVKSFYDHGITTTFSEDNVSESDNDSSLNEENMCKNIDNEDESFSSESESDYEQCKIDNDLLNQRVWGLETAVDKIRDLLSSLFTQLNKSGSFNKPLKKLRKKSNHQSTTIDATY